MYQNAPESPRHASEPPIRVIRGIRTSTSSPVEASNTCSVPSSVPCEDNDTATRRPSGEGTNQSIVVAPLGSSTFGSTITRSVDASVTSDNATRKTCCLGGWRFRANAVAPPASASRYDTESAPTISSARRRISA